jgi:hypothetical protein
MKVEVKETETEKELQFPCLMEYEDHECGRIIIMAIGKNGNHYIGLRLSQNVGEYATNWTRYFKPFKGSITLSND